MTKYEERFIKLSYHAAILIPTEAENVMRFTEGLNCSIKIFMARESETETTFHQAVEIARRIKHICS